MSMLSGAGISGLVAGGVAAAGGAVVAAVIAVGATQIVVNQTQPEPSAANTGNVSAPNYAE